MGGVKLEERAESCVDSSSRLNFGDNLDNVSYSTASSYKVGKDIDLPDNECIDLDPDESVSVSNSEEELKKHHQKTLRRSMRRLRNQKKIRKSEQKLNQKDD